MDCCLAGCWRHCCPPCSGDVLRDCNVWLWPVTRGCTCARVTVHSEWELLLCTTVSVPGWSLGWEMGQSTGVTGAGVLLHLRVVAAGPPPPAALGAASVTSWCHVADGWCRLASFLLEVLPFLSCLLLSVFAQPSCKGLWGSRTRSSACIGHVNPACALHVMGELWQGTTGRMHRDLPQAEEYQGHLATPPPGCLQHTMSLAYVLGQCLQPPHLSCVLLKEKLKGWCLTFQLCLMLASSVSTGEAPQIQPCSCLLCLKCCRVRGVEEGKGLKKHLPSPCPNGCWAAGPSPAPLCQPKGLRVMVVCPFWRGLLPSSKGSDFEGAAPSPTS